MAYRIHGLDPAPFAALYGLSDAELAAHGARRVTVTEPVSAPDRVELRDLDPGETALLVNHYHQPADTPFRACHAIFVREGATAAATFHDRIPDALARRMLSIRAFDAGHDIVDADLAEGEAIVPLVRRLLDRGDVAYLHAHYARRGCFAARIDRN